MTVIPIFPKAIRLRETADAAPAGRATIAVGAQTDCTVCGLHLRHLIAMEKGLLVLPNNRPITMILRSPLLWGTALSLGFYWLVHVEVFEHPLVIRYFASHPVEYIATTMFFVGLAALGLKCLDVARQLRHTKDTLLEPPPPGGQPASHAELLLERLKRLPQARQQSYLVRRLYEALENVHRRGSAEGLDEELKYLADLDAARLHASYALVRIIVWAIPILGFLGTVIGITLAIANLAPQALEDSLPEVTAGLGVAFDTTALALALSMVLMFAQFLTERTENRLLGEVDVRVNAQLVGRFETTASGSDAQLLAIRQMADAVVQFSERLVKRQAELWQGTIEAANERFSEISLAAGNQLESALSVALERSLQSFADRLESSSELSAEQNRLHWSEVQRALTESTDSIRSQQTAMNQQGELLLRVVDTTGEVVRLEDALNRNLQRLAGTQDFEEVLLTLSAAIQLLSARLGTTPASSTETGPKHDHTESQAA